MWRGRKGEEKEGGRQRRRMHCLEKEKENKPKENGRREEFRRELG